jgi:hypothetical protein
VGEREIGGGGFSNLNGCTRVEGLCGVYGFGGRHPSEGCSQTLTPNHHNGSDVAVNRRRRVNRHRGRLAWHGASQPAGEGHRMKGTPRGAKVRPPLVKRHSTRTVLGLRFQGAEP